MKKIVYIALMLIGITAVSCEKQVFAPNSDCHEAPEWQSSDRSRSPGEGFDLDDSEDGGIVDPNDPEESDNSRQ